MIHSSITCRCKLPPINSYLYFYGDFFPNVLDKKICFFSSSDHYGMLSSSEITQYLCVTLKSTYFITSFCLSDAFSLPFIYLAAIENNLASARQWIILNTKTSLFGEVETDSLVEEFSSSNCARSKRGFFFLTS